MKLADYKTEITNVFRSGLHIHGNPGEQVVIINPDLDTSNVTRFQYANMELALTPKGVKALEKVIEMMSVNVLLEFSQAAIGFSNRDIKLRPVLDLSYVVDTDDWGGAMGCNFIDVDKRFDGLFESVKQEFETLAHYLKDAAIQYRKDKTKFKDGDVYFFFNADAVGENTNVFLTSTKVPPLDLEGKGVPEVDRSPISPVLMDEYFDYPTVRRGIPSTYRDDINDLLDRVNKRIQEVYNNSTVKNFTVCKKLMDDKVNKILIPIVSTMKLAPYSTFGDGISPIDMMEGNSAAAIDASDTIDGEVAFLMDFVKSIPIPENSGVDHYAIDVDSLSIYGCDKDNELVSTMAEPRFMYATVMGPRHSDGFGKKFIDYLKTIKNPMFFSTTGKAVERVTAENEDELRKKAAKDLLASWKTSGFPPKLCFRLIKEMKRDKIDVRSINPETLETDDAFVEAIIEKRLLVLAHAAAGIDEKDIPDLENKETQSGLPAVDSFEDIE